MLALVAFDAVGILPDKVRVLPFAPDDKKPFFVMADRASLDGGTVGSGPSGQKVVLTSADAARAVPLVAFAARSFLDAHPDDVASFAKQWFSGNAGVRADAAGASRKIAAMPQAPEAVSMLERLGQMEPAAEGDLAPELVQELVRHEMDLWRAAGSSGGAAVSAVPVATATLSALAKPGPPDAGARPAPAIGPKRGGNVLLVRRESPPDGKLDEDAFGATVAWLATVFERSTIRVTVKGVGRTHAVVSAAVERLHLPERVTPLDKTRPKVVSVAPMTAAEAEQTSEEIPKGHPVGLYILFGTEMWERFSYYGMRALLVLYLIKIHGWQPHESSSVYKWYTSLVYLTPLLGGFLADRFLGLRTAIIVGGVLMAVGHFLMAFEPLPMFYLALAFLIAGNGFFKPNISTLVGKMYKKQDPRRDGAFTIFYMGINLGAFMAPLICGQWLRATYGFHYGFAAAGIGMMIGLLTFLFGQKYIRKAVLEAGNTMDRAPRVAPPPEPVPVDPKSAYRNAAEKEPAVSDDDEQRPAAPGIAGIVAKVMPFLMLAIAVVVPVRYIYLLATGAETLKGVFMPIAFSLIAGLMGFVLLTIKGAARDKSIVIFVLFFFVVLFWMAFEQAGNALNLWAEFFTQRKLVFFDMEAEAYQSINAIGIVILGPLFAWLWLRLARSGREPSTPLKMAIAMVFVALSFVAMVGAAVFEAQGESRVHLAKAAIPSSIDISKLNAGRLTYDDAKEELVVKGVLASYVVNDALTKSAAPEYRASVEAFVTETQAEKGAPYHGRLVNVPTGVDLSKLDEKLHASWGIDLGPGGGGVLTVSEPIDASNKTKLLGLGAPREWREALTSLGEKSDNSRVTGFWLFLSYMLATIGELCLSPVGLSMVTKLAPARFASLFMGVWMLASSVAQYAGGSIGESWGTITPSVYFNLFVLSSAIGAVILFVLVHPLKRLMHNVN